MVLFNVHLVIQKENKCNSKDHITHLKYWARSLKDSSCILMTMSMLCSQNQFQSKCEITGNVLYHVWSVINSRLILVETILGQDKVWTFKFVETTGNIQDKLRWSITNEGSVETINNFMILSVNINEQNVYLLQHNMYNVQWAIVLQMERNTYPNPVSCNSFEQRLFIFSSSFSSDYLSCNAIISYWYLKVQIEILYWQHMYVY